MWSTYQWLAEVTIVCVFNRNIEDPTVGPEASDQHAEGGTSLPNAQQETQHQTMGHRYPRDLSENTAAQRHELGGLTPNTTNTDEAQNYMEEFEFDEGMDDFDDFDAVEEDILQAEVMDGSALVDVPDDNHWSDDLDQFEDEVMENQDCISQTNEEPRLPTPGEGSLFPKGPDQYAPSTMTNHPNGIPTFPALDEDSLPSLATEQSSQCTASMITGRHSSGPKSKLSLKQKSTRTRVAETNTKNLPPVASVRPFQREESDKRQPLASDCNIKQPIFLDSLSEVSNHLWSLHPLVKVKVCVD